MADMSRTSPHPVDRHVGARVRARRVLSGISQVQLGTAIGVTFQQIQKYEKGANRISASKLQDIGTMLGVPAGYFFAGAPMPAETVPDIVSTEHVEELASFLATLDGAKLAKAFCLIKNRSTRRRIIELARSLDDGASAA